MKDDKQPVIPISDHLGTAGNNNAGERETRRKGNRKNITDYSERKGE
ncbi:MAG: hypothetical protein GX802_07005 [Clostridiales bacterium]|nr:hypothetical protein [Clostridiales bacterium]